MLRNKSPLFQNFLFLLWAKYLSDHPRTILQPYLLFRLFIIISLSSLHYHLIIISSFSMLLGAKRHQIFHIFCEIFYNFPRHIICDVSPTHIDSWKRFSIIFILRNCLTVYNKFFLLFLRRCSLIIICSR